MSRSLKSIMRVIGYLQHRTIFAANEAVTTAWSSNVVRSTSPPHSIHTKHLDHVNIDHVHVLDFGVLDRLVGIEILAIKFEPHLPRGISQSALCVCSSDSGYGRALSARSVYEYLNK